jgi:hypothetical protein
METGPNGVSPWPKRKNQPEALPARSASEGRVLAFGGTRN